MGKIFLTGVICQSLWNIMIYKTIRPGIKGAANMPEADILFGQFGMIRGSSLTTAALIFQKWLTVTINYEIYL